MTATGATAARELYEWLSCETETSTGGESPHCVVLCGSAVLGTLHLALEAALFEGPSERQRKRRDRSAVLPLIISGGVGHSTAFLYAALQHAYPDLRSSLKEDEEGGSKTPSSEAELLARYALPRALEQLLGSSQPLPLVQVHLLPEGIEVLGQQLQRAVRPCTMNEFGGSNDHDDDDGEEDRIPYALHVFLERASTNCGANAAMTVAFLQQALLLPPPALPQPVAAAAPPPAEEVGHPNSLLHVRLLQDPTMMRRSLLSFYHEWDKQAQQQQHAPSPSSSSSPVDDQRGATSFGPQRIQPCWTPQSTPSKDFLPLQQLCDLVLAQSQETKTKKRSEGDQHNVAGMTSSTQGEDSGYTAVRLLQLMIGEVPRLRNDANGYGPNGARFIAACDVPPHIERAAVDLGLFVQSIPELCSTRTAVGSRAVPLVASAPSFSSSSTPSASSPSPPFRIVGVSFDAEGTLLIYPSAEDTDASLLVQAVHSFNEEQSASRPLAIPQWPSENDRERCYNDEWCHTEALLVQRFALEEERTDVEEQYRKGVYRPWMTMKEAVLFYRTLIRRVLATGGVHVDNDHFADYVLYEFYGAQGLRHVYRPAMGRCTTSKENLQKLEDVAAKHPLCRWAVVSNTDSRVRDVLLQVPTYRRLFRGHIWTACDVDELKPSGWGILAARRQATTGGGGRELVRTETGSEKGDKGGDGEVWVHVGDHRRADGGAAAASGSLFVYCNAATGADFSVIEALLSCTSREEAERICAACT